MNHPFSIDNLPTCIPLSKSTLFLLNIGRHEQPPLFHLIELGAFRSVDHAVDTPSSLILENQTISMAEFSHCACANVILLGRWPNDANITQQHPTIPNIFDQSQTLPNIIQQYPTSSNNTQHGWPNDPNIYTQHCWHLLGKNVGIVWPGLK